MEFKLPNSIGHFYAAGAEYLGYTKPSGKRHAGKVMGLAPYGEFREEYSRLFDDLVDIQQGKYDVTDFRLMDVESLESLFGKRHSFPEEFEDRHKDFAYHLQNKTEQIIKHLVEYWINSTNTTNLSVAGGVFMNCKLNREISKMDCVDNLYIQPASNDSGIAIGAALEAHKIITSKSPEIHLNNLYLGPEYSGDQIETVLKTNKIQYKKCDDISKTTAKLLADDNLVGWFQGRLEFGARALGNRSILANPTSEESLEKVNSKVKNREGWRPFAPSILYESRKEYFRSGDEMPFMINTDIVKHNKQDKVPAIVHTDGSARPQTVRENSNPRYHRLLSEFERLTDVPMLLNTSFNISGEPIVESPNQAIQDFYTTALDVLVLEDYLITK